MNSNAELRYGQPALPNWKAESRCWSFSSGDREFLRTRRMLDDERIDWSKILFEYNLIAPRKHSFHGPLWHSFFLYSQSDISFPTRISPPHIQNAFTIFRFLLPHSQSHYRAGISYCKFSSGIDPTNSHWFLSILKKRKKKKRQRKPKSSKRTWHRHLSQVGTFIFYWNRVWKKWLILRICCWFNLLVAAEP